MTTEVIFAELKLYETNLTNLLTTYELANKNYLDSIRQKKSAESQRYLTQMNDLNLELLLLMREISQNIVKINNDDKYVKYKTDIAKKMADLNTLYSKIQEDDKNIKKLMLELNDLDGKNANFQIQHKTNSYYITLYLVLIGIIIFLLIRISLSSESMPYEIVVLILAILFLGYSYWDNISSWTETNAKKAGGATTTFIADVFN